MDKPQNKYIAVAYKLYSDNNGEKNLVEETSADKPFQFISGFGVTLESFEKAVIDLAVGGEFDFELSKDEAYGDYVDERVLDLDKNIFSINGHFDHENIYKDAIVPLQNEDGQKFYGRVLEVGEDKVKMDLNHPLAGKDLNFKGHIVENREATKEEIQGMLNRLSGEDGCGCGCDSCNGDCHDGDCHDGKCHDSDCHDGECGCNHNH